MNTKTIGFLLSALGIIMIVYTSFNYVFLENVVDVEQFQLNAKEYYPIQWSPIIGAVLVVGGILVLITFRKKYLLMYSHLNSSKYLESDN